MPFRTRIPNLFFLFSLGLPAVAASTSVAGIGNFSKVDETVYRGAQPTQEGFTNLAKLGIKVVLDLREQDDRAVSEERIVTAAGMRYINVPMSGLTPPTPAETDTILRLLGDSSAGPVFVHCKHGADRTGAVIAAYRIDHDKWQETPLLNLVFHANQPKPTAQASKSRMRRVSARASPEADDNPRAAKAPAVAPSSAPMRAGIQPVTIFMPRFAASSARIVPAWKGMPSIQKTAATSAARSTWQARSSHNMRRMAR